MNNVLMILLYSISWFTVIGMALLVVALLVQYVRLKHRSTKALIGLISACILWLAATIGLAVAQAHSIDLSKRGVYFLLLFDSFVIQCIYQWTIGTVQNSMQRTLRWILTSITILFGLIVIGFFIFVHS